MMSSTYFDKYSPNIKVHVQPKYGMEAVDVFITNSGGDGYFVARIKDNHLEWEKRKDDGVELEPTMTLPLFIWDIFKRSLMDNQERDKHTVEAELGATKYHLEDMRKLVLNQMKGE